MLLTMKIFFASISVRMTRTNQYNSLVPKIECFHHSQRHRFISSRFLWIKLCICKIRISFFYSNYSKLKPFAKNWLLISRLISSF